ncbi:MAG: hypothetical protein FWD66_06450 [Paludibacter sp.]|nr:hypothetical protein [Paludibacter sp.]
MLYLLIAVCIILAVLVILLYYKNYLLNWKVGYYEYWIKKYKDRFDKEQYEFIEDVLKREYFNEKYFKNKFPENLKSIIKAQKKKSGLFIFVLS